MPWRSSPAARSGFPRANAQGLAPEPAPENQDSVIGDAVGGAALDIGAGAVGLVVEGPFSVFF